MVPGILCCSTTLPLQHPRAMGSDRREVEEAARLAQIDSLIRIAPRAMSRGRRARTQIIGWRETTRGDSRTILKARRYGARRSDLRARQPYGRNSGCRRVSRNRTTLVIAHRLSTIVGADEIIVLDQKLRSLSAAHYALLATTASISRIPASRGAQETLARAGEKKAPNRNPPLIGCHQRGRLAPLEAPATRRVRSPCRSTIRSLAVVGDRKATRSAVLLRCLASFCSDSGARSAGSGR